MGRGLLEPWHIILLVVIVALLFGFKRLPDITRSVGRSMRIFKSEVNEMKQDGKQPSSTTPSDTVPGDVVPPQTTPPQTQYVPPQTQYVPPQSQQQTQQPYAPPQQQYVPPQAAPQPQYTPPANGTTPTGEQARHDKPAL